MKKPLIAFGLTAFLAFPALAQAFTAIPGVRVNPVNEAVFEVIPEGSGDIAGFWCGASEFARRALGADWQDTVYVLRGRGDSVTTNRSAAAHFTLDPKAIGLGPAPQGWLRMGLKAGDRMSVQSAHSYCQTRHLYRR